MSVAVSRLPLQPLPGAGASWPGIVPVAGIAAVETSTVRETSEAAWAVAPVPMPAGTAMATPATIPARRRTDRGPLCARLFLMRLLLVMRGCGVDRSRLGGSSQSAARTL
jgi:hypothetical protein